MTLEKFQPTNVPDCFIWAVVLPITPLELPPSTPFACPVVILSKKQAVSMKPVKSLYPINPLGRDALQVAGDFFPKEKGIF